MIYNDGFETDENLRFVKCPRCGNEEFSSDAKFCRICGLPVFNECEGSQEFDSFGNVTSFYHRNPGNARYCEQCGKPTMLYKETLLKPYKDVYANTQGELSSIPFSIEDEEDTPF